MPKEKFTIKRMSEEDLNRFAEEVFRGEWICPSEKDATNEPFVMLHISLFKDKYEVEDPEKVILWFEKTAGPRGFLWGSMKLVHVDDHNEVVRRLAEARKVVAGVSVDVS